MILPYYQIPFSVIIFQKLQVQKINQKTNYLQHSNIYLSTPNTGNYSSSNINSSTASISSFLPNESQTDIKLFNNLQQIFQNPIDFIYQAPQKLQPLTK